MDRVLRYHQSAKQVADSFDIENPFPRSGGIALINGVFEVCAKLIKCNDLPYDEEDESGAQHQGEHVAEGRKGERHGCASQPDDDMGRERERELSPALYLSLAIAPSPSFLEVIVFFLSGPLPPPPLDDS